MSATQMEGMTKVHLDFYDGPLSTIEPDPIFGGESVWAKELPDNHAQIDNLVLGTEKIGYRDIVRYQEFDEASGKFPREVVEITVPYPCWRGIVKPSVTPEEFVAPLRERFTPEQVQLEHGMGSFQIQAEPEVGEQVLEYLSRHPTVEMFMFDPVNLPPPEDLPDE